MKSRPVRVPAAAGRSASPPVRRTTYPEAVARYERGLQALQRRAPAEAADLFRSLLRDFPEERELHERVRLYLNVCERQATPREATPQTLEERLYAATLALNLGAHEEALGHLELAHREDPEHDHALYMLAVVLAQRGRVAEALANLQRAVALNPENLSLAKQDPDLETLRREDEFRALVEATQSPRQDRRRPGKTRGIR